MIEDPEPLIVHIVQIDTSISSGKRNLDLIDGFKDKVKRGLLPEVDLAKGRIEDPQRPLIREIRRCERRKKTWIRSMGIRLRYSGSLDCAAFIGSESCDCSQLEQV